MGGLPGDVLFHLDPLWASSDIDFIGIDNYMPVSDWRSTDGHTDAYLGSVYDPDYLEANIEGGEGYDWYYHSSQAREAQIRTEIVDQAHGEDWVWRYKDIRGWWQSEHHNRQNGVRQEASTDWVPASKPIRFTEFGCAAIDKGTNQPNKFLDPKSSESGLPHFSSGERDELIQRQYFKAMLKHWKDSFNNPISAIYNGSMIDMDHAYAWAWDARPYPAFPTNSDLWSDAGNYATGHWLNGRSSSRSLSSVLVESCKASGVTSVDADHAYGIVRGYLSDKGDTARSELQPLLLAYGVDAFEGEGKIIFKSRSASTELSISSDALVAREVHGDLEHVRSAEMEEAGRIRIGFIEADGEFANVWEDASLAGDKADVVSVSEFPLVLTRSEGRLIAERWLAESKVARDRVSFSVPQSCTNAKVGRVVELADGSKFRIDRMESAESKEIEAVRVDPKAYSLARIEEDPPTSTAFLAPLPVYPVFLDIPLIDGSEDPYSPHVAVTAKPWPGKVGVFKANATGTFDLNQSVSERASIGQTENALFSAPNGIVDRGSDLQVRMASGTLDSASWASVLSGANRVAIGSGSPDAWEIFQFEEAELIGTNTYLLRNRLRGQFGTGSIVPNEWPVGSMIVLLDDAVNQLLLVPSDRELSQTLRTGPLGRPLDDTSFVETDAAFSGVGLRPYSPCHVKKVGHKFTWTRRTRVGGDNWSTSSVPLGEETEAYRVRVRLGGAIVREEEVSATEWTYSPVAKMEDGVETNYELEIAQLSAEFGAGGAVYFAVSE
ncbi:MAG: glycoside hydrolase/phage tail family protein [Paracoccaceae bacterium]|nr:glycoside hydrolase/phage tail family protein [Paracoccaceae bacterium]MDG2257957.1 glycoside hydrolase/phage tail family protein [Paracoccaceae bacterium]